MPEKYVHPVQDMCRDIKALVRCSVGHTERLSEHWAISKIGAQSIPVRPGYRRHCRGCQLSAASSMMFADDIALCGNTREEVERKLEAWRRVLEERSEGEQEKDGVHGVQRSERQEHHTARVCAEESGQI